MLRQGLLKEYSKTITWIAKIIDVFLCVFACVIAYFIYFGHFHLSEPYIQALFFIGLLIVPIFSVLGLYESFRGRTLLAHFGLLYCALGLVLLAFIALVFITKTSTEFSRAWLFISFSCAAILLSLSRILLKQALDFMRKKNLNQRKVIVIGAGDLAFDLLKKVNAAMWTGFHIVELLDDNPKQNQDKQKILIKKIPKNFEEYIRKLSIDEIWLTLPLRAETQVKELLTALRHNTVTIRYFPDIFGLQLLNHSIVEMMGFPAINLRASPMTGIKRIVKAIEDRILSLIILLLISPLLILIATLIKLSSSGPVFYRQKRVSWNGEEFNMLKFRSMPVNAESETGAVWAKAGEQRATKLGTFLRKLSLDELPQFINVLRGDMSIVGPRPERPVFVEKFKDEIPRYMQKHLVKGGITGWAQINGWRGSTALDKRIEFDLYYIENWSLWFDLKIIFLTLFKGFVNKNAY